MRIHADFISHFIHIGSLLNFYFRENPRSSVVNNIRPRLRVLLRLIISSDDTPEQSLQVLDSGA